MSTRYIRETVIGDIVELIKGIKDDDIKVLEKLKPKNNKYKTSISKSSKDLIMTFPVICSNTIDPKTATMISKAIERKCVTMLQILFSAHQADDVESVEDFIKQFHNNINLGNMSVDQYIDLTDKLAQELKFTDKSFFESGLLEMVNNDMKNLPIEKVLAVDSINETSLQSYKIVDRYGDLRIIKEASNDDDSIKGDHDFISDPADPKNSFNQRQKRQDLRNIKKNEYEIFNKQLLDTDVKKCNEMVPSLLIINVCLTKDGQSGSVKGKVYLETSAIVGVKARLVPTDSFDIIDRLYAKHNDSNKMLKLIRATTREISFVKDFLLAVDKAKIDVLSKSKKGSASRMWKVLERRSIKSNINKALRRANDASAIASLVLTQEEADFLNKNYNINLNHIGTAANILAKYNLLSLVIVDETIEVVKFLFDGDDSFETLSFSNLERESGDGMYKKVLNLMTKINR